MFLRYISTFYTVFFSIMKQENYVGIIEEN